MKPILVATLLLASCTSRAAVVPPEDAVPVESVDSAIAASVPEEAPAHPPAPTDHAPDDVVEPIPVDDFTAFVDRLLGLEDGARERVAIVLLGDSHIASDTFSHRLRVLLQDRYGNGGRGYAYPGEPWDNFRQRRMRYGMDGSWTVENGARRSWTAPLGLGGIRLHSAEADATIWRATADENDESRFDTATIHYVVTPGGGSFEVRVDDVLVDTVSTDGDRLAPGVFAWVSEAPASEIRLRVVGDGEVSVSGIATERSDGGIIVDSLGINGARATQFLAFDESLVVGDLAARMPAAYLVAFGTNEAYGSRFRQEADEPDGEADRLALDYEDDFGALLDRYSQAAPDAACIVLLPPDFNDDSGPCEAREWSSGGRCNEFDGCTEAHLHEFCVRDAPDSLERVAAAQRRAALARGCAVWDQQFAMGGPGAHSAWQQWQPALAAGDGVHLTSAGYDVLAEAFFADLDAAVRLRRAGAPAAVLQTSTVFPPHHEH